MKTQTLPIDQVNKFTLDEIPKEIHGIKLNERTREILAKGELSPLIEGMHLDENTYKNAKIKLTRDNSGEIQIHYSFQNEQLLIPEKIGKHKLTPDEKQKLLNNETVGPLNHEGTPIYLQIDKELNSIVVKGEKELSIPSIIGASPELGFKGYVLTDEDKNKLANGGELKPHLMAGNDGYFVAKFSLTDDRKGVVFSEIQTIPFNKVKEIEEKLNNPKNNLVENVSTVGKDALIEQNQKTTNTIEQVTETGIDVIAGTNQTKKETQEKQISKTTEEINLQAPDKTKDVTVNKEQDLSKEFYSAVEKKDFVKINQLSEQGWKPAEKEIKHIESSPNLSVQDKVAIQTIFKIEPEQSKVKDNKTTLSKDPKLSNNKSTDKEQGLDKGVSSAKNVTKELFKDM